MVLNEDDRLLNERTRSIVTTFKIEDIDHKLIQNVGTNTHTQIDSHISDSSLHFSDLSGFDTGDLSEGSNLYFTEARAINAINNDIDHGSTAQHNYFSGSHDDLTNISTDDHHTKYTDSEAVSAVETADNYIKNDGDTATGDYTFDTDTLHIDSTNGRVGIGTTSPSSKLDVNGGLLIGGSAAGNLAEMGTTQNFVTWNTGYNDDFTINMNEGDFVINEDNDNLFNVKANGNVGIGTTSPSQKLEVSGTAGYETTGNMGTAATAFASKDYVDTASGSGLIGSGTTNYISKWTDNDTLGDSTIYDSGGYVGIGTNSPSETLDVDGDINIPESSAYKIGGIDIIEAQSYPQSLVIGETTADTSKSKIVAVGRQAGKSATGDSFTAVGRNAGYYAGGLFTAQGVNSGSNAGDGFTAQGINAGTNAGDNFAAQGLNAGGDAGSEYIAQGYKAGYGAGDRFTALGYESTNSINSLSPLNINDSIAIGYQSAPQFDGHFVVEQANLNSNPLIEGNLSEGSVAFGSNTLSGLNDGDINISDMYVNNIKGKEDILDVESTITRFKADRDIGDTFTVQNKNNLGNQATRFFVGNAGNDTGKVSVVNSYFGVGTASPGVPLEIVGEAKLSATTDMGSNDSSLATKKYVDDLSASDIGLASLTDGTGINTLSYDGTSAESVSLDTSYTDGRYLRKDANTTQDDGLYIGTDQIRARDAAGLKVYDDDGNGLFIQDGGQIGIGITDPGAKTQIDMKKNEKGLIVDYDDTVITGMDGTGTGITAKSRFSDAVYAREGNSGVIGKLATGTYGVYGEENSSVSGTSAIGANGDITLEPGSGDFVANDGSKGWSGSFTNGDGATVTVKNGIITNVV